MTMDGGYVSFLAERRERILANVREACAKAGRSTDEIEIIAVSKTVGPEEVAAAYGLGWRLFGENRPQELVRKLNALEGDPVTAGITFDMIGNLQKNKINQVLGRARLIHSVSSAHLAQAISKRAQDKNLVAQVLLEVNVSGEASKSGFAPDGVRAGIEGILELEGIAVEGLMTMAPIADEAVVRRTFSGLRELRDDLSIRSGLPLATLSCGMSDDYVIAIEEGSSLVRLGRTVFSEGYDQR